MFDVGYQKQVVFQARNDFGLEPGQMAIFDVVRLKPVDFSSSERFWAETWTNGDFRCWLLEKSSFFQNRNYFGLKVGQMAKFHVVYQKQVVFSSTELFWAENWTNGDIPCGLSETSGFSNSE